MGAGWSAGPRGEELAGLDAARRRVRRNAAVEITEVRVKLVPQGRDKLRAFCSITIDHQFVIRDLKVIESPSGAFVAMPSRKLTARCPRCGGKNHFRARYCNDCGNRLAGESPVGGAHARGGSLPDRGKTPAAKTRFRYHADVAHPINSVCREMIQGRVLEVYHEELERSREPGYQPMEIDVFDEAALTGADDIGSERPAESPAVSPRLASCSPEPQNSFGAGLLS
jgi:stage V sporulation protein G